MPQDCLELYFYFYLSSHFFNLIYVIFLDSQTAGQDSWKDEYIRNYHEYTQSLVSMSSDSEEAKVTLLSSDDQSTKDIEKSVAGCVVSSGSNFSKTENILKTKSETSSQSSESEHSEQERTDSNNLHRGGVHGKASGIY